MAKSSWATRRRPPRSGRPATRPAGSGRAGHRTGLLLAAAFTLAHAGARAANAQSVLDRPPNAGGAWVAEPGVLQFNFLHRFGESGPPARKVVNSPTFLLGIGLPASTMVGVNYATNSELVERIPNEWEFFGRYGPVLEARGAPLDLVVQAGYNLAAESVDGEVAVARRFGPARLLGAMRALGPATDEVDAEAVFVLGATVRLGNRPIALAGDVAARTNREPGEPLAWSAGVQLEIPYTPHSFSLHASNTNAATLRSASRGLDRVRYGFEFTIPLTLRRYLGGGGGAPPAAAVPPAQVGAGVVALRQFAFVPARIEVARGTTVTWRNEDPVPHTVTAVAGEWDSGEIAPGATWQRTFDTPGEYAVVCTPHPFMTAVIVVR